jgi:hypothetical protein
MSLNGQYEKYYVSPYLLRSGNFTKGDFDTLRDILTALDTCKDSDSFNRAQHNQFSINNFYKPV